MPTTQHYDDLIASLAAGDLTDLARKIYSLLKRLPDGCTRLQLIEYCYGADAASDAARHGINNSDEDRKIRKAIEFARDSLIPIVANSGEAGYRLETNTESIRAMVGEWKTRIAKMDARVKAWERQWPEICADAERQEPVQVPQFVTQPALFSNFRGTP